MNNKRYLTIDLIRGISVISMVLYHLMYDLKYMFDQDMPFFSIQKCYIWQQSICISFIIIAGISLNFNSKKLHHGIKLLITSILITIVTHVFVREYAIYFGIIHFLAIGIIIIFLLEKFLNKIHNLLGFILNLGIFVIIRTSYYLNSSFHINIFKFLSKFKLGFIFGFPKNGFYSSDYFPIFPWIFLLITGFYLGKIIKFDSLLKIKNNNIFVIIGQKSLEIYLLHQVIIYSVLSLILK